MSYIGSNFAVPTKNSTDNISFKDVIGNKEDSNSFSPGKSSLYTLAGYMTYYHTHGPSRVFPLDAPPVQLIAGAGAYTEGAITEIVAKDVTTLYRDIHHIILGNISQNDDYIIKIYTGDVGEEEFWGEAGFTRDTNQVRGSDVPIQGNPIAPGTRISATLESGTGSNNAYVKLFTHPYGV